MVDGSSNFCQIIVLYMELGMFFAYKEGGKEMIELPAH